MIERYCDAAMQKSRSFSPPLVWRQFSYLRDVSLAQSDDPPPQKLMAYNSKQLNRTNRLVNFLIASVLAFFLIALSYRIIGDTVRWYEQPEVGEFEDRRVLDSLADLLSQKSYLIDSLESQEARIRQALATAEANYAEAQESYNNWLRARNTIGSPDQDEAILSRARELDEVYQVTQAWRKKQDALNQQIAAHREENTALQQAINQAHNRAYELQRRAMRQYELKVFLIRLLFILPLLLLGIYFLLRFRGHKYWPLFLGYIIFSFYAFFIGLVPYLPWYGGYVRYSIGIVISIGLGSYAINRIRAFTERKKQELKSSSAERAKNVQVDTAEKSLNAHICPSCGKDFIQKSWSEGGKKAADALSHSAVTNFCRFCGLQLFKPCARCEFTNFAHLPFCANCGEPQQQEST